MSITDTKSPIALKHYKEAIKKSKNNQFIEAEALLAIAITEDEAYHSAWYQLGLIWNNMSRFDEASQAFQMCIQLNPRDAKSHFHLGHTLIQLGQTETGIKHLNQAADLSDDAQMGEKTGDIFRKLKDYKTSSFFYLKAYKKDKFNPELCKKLASTLFQIGDSKSAIHIMRDLVLRFPNNEGYLTFLSEMMYKQPLEEFDAPFKKLIETAFAKDTIRHRYFAPTWVSLFLTDSSLQNLREFPKISEDNQEDVIKEIAFDLSSPFICLGLQKIIPALAPIENIFSSLRRYFMTHWENYAEWPKGTLDFLSSLAVQNWYNDFIYFETPEEKIVFKNLMSFIKDNIDLSKKIGSEHATLLALASCYQPIYDIVGNNTELNFAPSCKKQVEPFITAQYTYPRIEKSLIPTIKSFTEIEDLTSKAVQAMYEQRPYPRWTNMSRPVISETMASMSENIDVLVAGCGTGQEPCMLATTLPRAHITAIDLSRTSIAYGMRMAKKLDLSERITFLHGDLMKVSELNKKFDYIVSSGVLHHLKEPEKGLSAILAMLKPSGKMAISLYSQIARDYLLNPANEYITEKGYTSSLDDIRQFRQDIFGLKPDDPRVRCARAADFFSLSECNDLLFHIQEHRYTFPMIRDMAERHGLDIFHVGLTPDKKELFMTQYPDGQVTDWELMNKFELENPGLFAEMYKVFFHRKGENIPHPLDTLILLGSL